jgi:hypothetical protein
MKAVKETVGKTSVLIQTMDEKLEVIGATQKGPDIVDTGIEEDVKEAYAKAKAVMRAIAEDLGAELGNIRTDVRPKQMEIEFNMGLSAEANAWIIGVKNDCALKVKMTWETEKNV